MLRKLFGWLAAKKSSLEPWRLQTLNWHVEEYQLDWELAASEVNPELVWLSVGDTAKQLDQGVKAQRLMVFCYHNQEFAQAEGIWFEMLMDNDLVFILANDAQMLFAPLAQQYRKIGTTTIRDNRANQLIWQHDMLLPEAIIQHKRDLMMISHDADSIFLITQS